MPESVTTWTMTRNARAAAAERAITDAEIANVLADPDVDVATAEDPRLRYVGRAGVYLVIDPKSHSIVAVDEQKTRLRAHPVTAEPAVKIRRRPVPDRPHPNVPTALLSRPKTPPPPELVFAAPLLPVPAPPVAAPPVAAERAQEPERPKPKLNPGPDPRPTPELPAVLDGILAPRPRPAPRPAPLSRPRVTAPSADKLAGVHPGIAASVRTELKKRGLDESRIVVHSPTNVEIR